MMKFPANVLALALLASPPAMAAIILIDGDTIDVDGTRIRIVSTRLRPSGHAVRTNWFLVSRPRNGFAPCWTVAPVTFKPTGTDRYGRTLAYVMLAGLM